MWNYNQPFYSSDVRIRLGKTRFDNPYIQISQRSGRANYGGDYWHNVYVWKSAYKEFREDMIVFLAKMDLLMKPTLCEIHGDISGFHI